MTFRKSHPPVGARPGTLAIPPNSPPPKIRLVRYDADSIEEREIDDVATLANLGEDRVTWVDVRGLGDEAVLRQLATLFGMHPLALEDAVNVPHRAASTLYENQQVLIARVPVIGEDGSIDAPQVCFVLGRRSLVTFQERPFGFFDPVRERLRAGIGPIRKLGPDYLAYALIDLLIDRYYPVVQELSEAMEELEEEVIEQPLEDSLGKIHQVQRKLVVIRRIGAPQREALATLLRDHSPLVSEPVRVFLRDTHDHAAQIMEAVDSTREMGIGLVNLHLSNVSQRTNEVMKTLTLVASIFIPLSFLAGVYGMNFDDIPGIHRPESFAILVAGIVAIAGTMLWWFRRRGWLGTRRR
ncbi:MAG: magnesium/cobalt transporter CorA [Proteobacteria bacterium]|nr:magnesium/cobalt transporter CorA [Pseudomonadota bacterium]